MVLVEAVLFYHRMNFNENFANSFGSILSGLLKTMGLYSIAGFTVAIKNRYEYLDRQCKPYQIMTNVSADFSVSVCEEEVREERSQSDACYDNGYLESVCVYRKLCTQIPRFDAMLLHAAVISAENRGIAFLARSGVGKTTHMLYWKKLLGEMCSIINGDKPIIRFFNGIPFAYGTPWAGKENLQTNTKNRLTDLCFIERSKINFTRRMRIDDCIDLIMSQILFPPDAQNLARTLEMVEMLLRKCDLWLIKCTNSVDAAKAACNAILKWSDFHET